MILFVSSVWSCYRCKKQVILQAELIQKYREKVDRRPLAVNSEQARLIREATQHEVAALKAELMSKTTELIAATATLAEQGTYLLHLKLIT
jgi:hypothetical protein